MNKEDDHNNDDLFLSLFHFLLVLYWNTSINPT